MAIRIHGHQVKITKSLRSYIESKLPRIEKYTDRIQNLEIMLEKDGYQYMAELRLKAGPIEVTAKQKDTDPSRAVDKLIDKAEIQLKKKYEKQRGKKKHLNDANRSAKKADLSPESEPVPLIEARGPVLGNGHDHDDGEDMREMPLLHEKLNIRIFRGSHTAAGRMSVHQAAEELFHRDETFLCFRNAETDGISILYRRKDGNFAMMEPEGRQ